MGLPFVVLHDFAELGLEEGADLLNSHDIGDAADEHLGVCEGSLDAKGLLVDGKLLECADLLHFGGGHHQKHLVLALLLAQSDMLWSQLGLRQRVDDQRLDL